MEIVTIEQVLADGIYNDLGFVVGDRLIVLAEAQSTWSENIVIRELIYLMRTYQEYINKREINLYGKKRAKLPLPEMYMIYTKDRDGHPDELSLKKLFFNNLDICPIDARVKVIYLDDTMSIISQYISFCMVFDEQKKLYGRSLQTIRETIRICIDKNLLRKYLESR